MSMMSRHNRLWPVLLASTAALLSSIAAAVAADLVLVDAGKARSVVVTADRPSPVATYAAGELVAHVEKATGVRLEVVGESEAPVGATRVYIGDTQAARKAGLDPDRLPGETYRVTAVDGSLYILGREDGTELFTEGDKQNAIVRDTLRGTFYGVCEFLERFVGVRWLWPGELGTYVPRKPTLMVDADLDISKRPACTYRRYRIGSITSTIAAGQYPSAIVGNLAFSEDGLQRYYEELRRYLLVHQEGDSAPKRDVGHHFEWWWGKYGDEHPDWFAHTDNEGAPQVIGAERGFAVRMCVSNPELQRFIVEEDWDGSDWLSIGESDSRGYCRCPQCMAWDAPQPEGYNGYTTSNRYVRFAQAIHDRAVKRNPNVKILMFMYMDYTHAPTIDADLSWAYGEFVPWGSGNQCWYPMTPEEHQANKDAWLGWSRTGMEMCYRPNHLLGYTMPNLSTRQVGDMIRFAGAHGMVGFDYDSLLGQWAVRGPMLYVHMRLGTDPTRSVDQIREEYFSAFGPAAGKVEAYFDYWEDYSTTKALHGGADWGNCSQARKQYPPEAFAPAEALLSEAFELAATTELPEFAARVRFLQAGLEHARLAANFVGLYEDQQFPEARQALLDLAAFRRAHEQDFIADYLASATTESRTYPDLESLWEGNMLVKTEAGVLAIPTGAHKYSDAYARNSGKPLFGPIETTGLRPDLWGYVLDPDQEGRVIHRFRAADGYVFKRFEFMPFLTLPQPEDRTDKTYNRVEFSTDGNTFETLYENVPGFDPGAYRNLTHKAQGLNEFYIRISAGFPGKTWLVYRALNVSCDVADSVGFAPGLHQLTESFALAEEPGDLYPVEAEGLRRSKWGFAVEPDQEGYVTHRFRAGDGCVFRSFEFMPWLMLPKESDRTEKTYNKVEFSADGRNYELLHENAQTYREASYWDLTDRVRGLGVFYVRISAGFPRKTALAYVRAAAKFEVSE